MFHHKRDTPLGQSALLDYKEHLEQSLSWLTIFETSVYYSLAFLCRFVWRPCVVVGVCDRAEQPTLCGEGEATEFSWHDRVMAL